MAVAARGKKVDALLAVFNRTPPVRLRLTKTEVASADVWSKPRGIQALVFFYSPAGCFQGYMRMLVARLRIIFPKVDFNGRRA
jgi:hypothetical protein